MLKKNQKNFVREVTLLIKGLADLPDLKNSERVKELLEESVPKMMNNFDKQAPEYGVIQSTLFDSIEGLAIVLKFCKKD
jgi:uncharacterized membrane-anchored protein